MAKSCTRTGSGCPLGRNSRPPFLKSPTSSFFFVSMLGLLGLPAPAAMTGDSLLERNPGGEAPAVPLWGLAPVVGSSAILQGRGFRHPYGRVSILTRVFRTGSNTLALPQPDPDVLRLARRGDERAFAIIVRQYHGPVFNYVTRVLSGDRALAEDICQEVFMRVYQALPGFDGRCQFTTWLFQVAKHRVVDELRARERRGRPALELEAAPQLHLAVAPPDADDGMDAVWIAIGGLSVDLKMALLLRDLVGLSYAEIAESLDTTLATVKWRIYKARETVVAELLREGYDFGHRRAVEPPVAIG